MKLQTLAQFVCEIGKYFNLFHVGEIIWKVLMKLIFQLFFLYDQ